MASALLARTEFPIYTIRALDENHFLVAGGGGSSKTGVPNAFVSLFIYLKYVALCMNETIIPFHHYLLTLSLLRMQCM